MAIEQLDGGYLRAIVDEFPDGVLIAREDDEVLFANETLGQILGKPSTEIQGQTLTSVLAAFESGVSIERIDREGGTLTEGTVRHDGRSFVLSSAELPSEEGRLRLLTVRPTAERGRDDDFFQRAFESANDAILVFDPSRDEFLDCNPSATELLGYSRTELLSMGPSDVHPHEMDAFQSFVDDVLRDGGGWTDELSCYTCDGDTLPAEISASRVTVDGRPCVLASIRDISKRKRFERRMETLTETTRELMTAHSVGEVGEITLEFVERVLDCPVSAVWEYDPDGNRLVPVVVSEEAQKVTEEPLADLTFAIEPGTAEMSVFRTGEAVFYDDYTTVADPAHPNLSLAERFVLPLGDHGLLTVCSTAPDRITPSMRDVFRVVAGNTETALDRLDSQRELRRRSTAMEAASDGIAILNEDGKFVFVNPAYADIFGYTDSDALVEAGWQELLDEQSIQRMEETVLPAVETEGTWRGELSGVRQDGSSVDLGVAVTGLDDGGYVNVCSDITEQKRQQRRLEALNELDHELMQASDRETITRLGTETVTDCLPFNIAAVRLFDETANSLELEHLTDSAERLLADRPAYDLESTYAGTAYRRGEPVVREPTADDLQTEHASLHVPLREYGTLSVLATDRREFEEDTVEFVRLVGTALGIAFERFEREQELREGRDELTRRNRINGVIRDIIQSLVEAGTRDEIERVVCQRLTDTDLYEYAWIGETDLDEETVVPRVSAGVDTDRLRVTAGMDLFETGTETVLDAVRNRRIETVRQYHVDEGSVSEPAVRDPEHVEVVAAVPLTYESQVYGVLVVGTTRTGTFEQSVEAEFELLSEVAGFAINAVRNRQLLLSNRITELKFEVRDRRNVVVAVSEELDCKCRLEIAEPTDGGGVRCYARLRELDGDTPAERIQSLDGIEEANVVGDRSSECLLEIVQTEQLAQQLARAGANVRTAVADSGEGEVVLEVAHSADIREIVDTFRSLYPDSELVAKRERERTGQSVDGFRATVEESLTDRQRSVLENAYRAGYFDWPRESTAEEVADRIGISAPTLHQHLRLAERKLLSALLDEE